MPKVEETTNRTVMVYMVANNNLVNEAYENINQMEMAFDNIQGTLLVYAKLQGENPAIYQIRHDETAQIQSKKIKVYGNHNAADPAVMRSVIADMQNLATATSYGLVLWSHASSWFPAKSIASDVSVQSFGDDAGREMDLMELATALPDHLDFILFDACYMGSIEVLYQLRQKAKYLLASPSEVIAGGMPYHLLTKYLFNDNLKDGLTKTAKTYYEFYQQKQGLHQSATITLIDAAQLENLAMQTTQFIISKTAHNPLERDGVQRLDFATGSLTNSFDFIDSFQKNYPKTSTSDLEKCLNEVVVYKAHTSSFNGQKINVFSGVSIYLPQNNTNWDYDYYQRLDWCQSVTHHLF